MAGGLIGSMFGQKPVVPELPSLNLQAETAKALASSQANLPAAEKLVASENLFSQNQIEQMLTSIIPNYKSITSQVGTNIESELKGQLPPDVQAAVQNSAAARSLGSGTAGSGFSKDLVARDLGITSLQMTDRGLLSAESWIAQAASIYQPSMDTVKRFATTPEQQAMFDVEERNSQWERQWLANQVSAMPDPFLNQVYNVIHQLGMAAIGATTGMNTGSPSENKYEYKGAPQGDVGGTTLNWEPGVQDVMDPGFNYGQEVAGADAAIASEDAIMASEFDYNQGPGNNITTGWGNPSMGDQLSYGGMGGGFGGP